MEEGLDAEASDIAADEMDGGKVDEEGRIVEMRDAGAGWNEIGRAFNLTRQQARHAYQRGQRELRRNRSRS